MSNGPSPASSPLGQFARFALIVFAAACALMVLLDPIKYTDTDPWIHLSGGQYFFDHGWRFPHDSYFSFLEPPRPWLSYAWAFQALIYWIFTGTGYQGLLVMRTLLYIAMAALIIRFLFHRGAGEAGARGEHGPAPLGWLAFIGVLVLMVVLPRYLNIRPHLFTYPMIMLFLWILEFRPRQAVWLPVLGVIWCNVHGIAFPVMLLILGAYALEYVIRRFKKGSHDPAEERRVFVPIVITMATVYATPLGARLIEAPIRSLDYLSFFVNELIPLSVAEMTSISVSVFQPGYTTAVIFLVLAAGLAFVTGVYRRTLRVSHVLMFLAGAYLLYRGRRFCYEFALLSLPLFRANPVVLSLGNSRVFASRVAAWAVTFILMLLPVAYLVNHMKGRGAYPFSRTGLPVGVCLFLNQIDATGNVLNAPNSGGYLRWKLYPKYKIHIDMDSYFEDSDFYTARQLLYEPHLLQEMFTKYDPSFITLPVYLKKCREMLVDFPDYRPVYFDDAEVLYANRKHYPELVAQYELRSLEPSKVMDNPLEALLADASPAEIEAMAREAGRMLAIYPEAGNLNYMMGQIYLREGRFDRVLEHALPLVRVFPEFAHGYLMLGDALDGLGDQEGALEAYATSLDRSGAPWEEAYKQMGEVYLDRGEYEQAYRYFVKGIDPLGDGTTLDDLYMLGWAALRSKRPDVAKALFTFMLDLKLPPEEVEWRQKVQGLMRDFGLEDKEDG